MNYPEEGGVIPCSHSLMNMTLLNLSKQHSRYFIVNIMLPLPDILLSSQFLTKLPKILFMRFSFKLMNI